MNDRGMVVEMDGSLYDLLLLDLILIFVVARSEKVKPLVDMPCIGTLSDINLMYFVTQF